MAYMEEFVVACCTAWWIRAWPGYISLLFFHSFAPLKISLMPGEAKDELVSTGYLAGNKHQAALTELTTLITKLSDEEKPKYLYRLISPFKAAPVLSQEQDREAAQQEISFLRRGCELAAAGSVSSAAHIMALLLSLTAWPQEEEHRRFIIRSSGIALAMQSAGIDWLENGCKYQEVPENTPEKGSEEAAHAPDACPALGSRNNQGAVATGACGRMTAQLYNSRTTKLTPEEPACPVHLDFSVTALGHTSPKDSSLAPQVLLQETLVLLVGEINVVFDFHSRYAK
ncbi:hypothetical protein EK904_009923 [Melospiza melodia maxima]|nr:hypothetical protein EK904_009923 [Melospiza melodia maxima]